MPRKLKVRPLTVESQAPIIDELERCAIWVYQKFGGDRLALPALTIGIQTRGKKHKLCGSFKKEGFSTKEGDPVHEIIITAEHLFNDPFEVLGTVVHETVHLFNHDRGEKDCSKGGRHNETFRETAEAWGLEVAPPTDAKGHAYTSLSPELRKSLETDFAPAIEVFRIFKEQAPIPEPKSKVKKQQPWVCDCPVTVQVATGVDLKAQCNGCDTDFRRK